MENRLTHADISDKEHSFLLLRQEILRVMRNSNSRYILITMLTTSDIVLEYDSSEDAAESYEYLMSQLCS